MVEPNYVILEPGVPKALHFTDHALATVMLADPLLKIDKPVNRLTFVVDEEDGRPVAKTYGITSSDHQAYFQELLAVKQYRGYTFLITKRGEGFRIKYSVVRLPRT